MAVSVIYRVAHVQPATDTTVARVMLFPVTDYVGEEEPLLTLHWSAQLTLGDRSLVVTPVAQIHFAIADSAVAQQLGLGRAVRVVFA